MAAADWCQLKPEEAEQLGWVVIVGRTLTARCRNIPSRPRFSSPYSSSLSLSNEALLVVSFKIKNLTLLLCQIRDGCIPRIPLFLGD